MAEIFQEAEDNYDDDCLPDDVDPDDSRTELEANFTELIPRARSSDWIIDSGASSHVSGTKDAFSNLNMPGSSGSVSTASGSKLPIIGQGTVHVDTNKSISNVLYVPGLQRNLMSVGTLTDAGHIVMFDSKSCHVFDKDNPRKVFVRGTRDPYNKLYHLRQLPPSAPRKHSTHSAFTVGTTLDRVNLWHRRLSHVNFQTIHHMSQRGLALGLPRLPHVKHLCDTCILAKHHRDRIPKRFVSHASRPLELIHSDLCGPVLAGTSPKYILTFIDDFSRFTWVYFLSYKSETFSRFKEFLLLVEQQLSHKISCLRSDRGGEYLSTDFLDFCRQNGIRRQLTVAHSPHQNGVAECKNRTLLEGARSIIIGCSLRFDSGPKPFALPTTLKTGAALEPFTSRLLTKLSLVRNLISDTSGSLAALRSCSYRLPCKPNLVRMLYVLP